MRVLPPRAVLRVRLDPVDRTLCHVARFVQYGRPFQIMSNRRSSANQELKRRLNAGASSSPTQPSVAVVVCDDPNRSVFFSAALYLSLVSVILGLCAVVVSNLQEALLDEPFKAWRRSPSPTAHQSQKSLHGDCASYDDSQNSWFAEMCCFYHGSWTHFFTFLLSSPMKRFPRKALELKNSEDVGTSSVVA